MYIYYDKLEPFLSIKTLNSFLRFWAPAGNHDFAAMRPAGTSTSYFDKPRARR